MSQPQPASSPERSRRDPSPRELPSREPSPRELPPLIVALRVRRAQPAVETPSPEPGASRAHAPAPGASSREDGGWRLDALSGRLAEISCSGATAALTAATALVLEAQLRGEPAAWVAVGDSIFFPPDLARSGIDLDALPVVRVPDVRSALRAADPLLRSGAFALVVLDLGAEIGIPGAAQTRLAGLAKKHHTALLCLTRKQRDASSLGSLVSLRGESRIKRTAFDRFTWELHIIKDKRRGPGWRHAEVCRGPDGLC
jgi:recombination protein RecA